MLAYPPAFDKNDLFFVQFRKTMEANGGEQSDAPPRGHRAADEAPVVGERSEHVTTQKTKKTLNGKRQS